MKAFGRILSILVGIVISMSGAAMLISGSTSLDAFYDVGFVCDYPDTQYCNVVQESGQSDKNGRITIESGDYSIYLTSIGTVKKKKGNYLYMDISDINGDLIPVEVVLYKGYDRTEKPVFSKKFKLSEGENNLDISGHSFKLIRVWIGGQENLEFQVNEVQTRENKNEFSLKRFLIYFCLIFLIYAVIYIVLRFCLKKLGWSCKIEKLYFIIEILQNIYMDIGRSLYIFIPVYIKKRKAFFSTILFSIIMIHATIMDNAKLYVRYFKYHMLFYVLILVIVAVINCDQKLSKVNWRTPLALSWLLFWCMVCLSDFKVTKLYQFVGYIGLLVLGFLIFVMNNDRKQVIVSCFKNAVHLYYLACLIFCMLFRPLISGMRYLGFSWNPSIFAICITTVLAVTLGELDNYVLGYLSKKRAVLHVLELGSIWCLLLLSQAIGPFLVSSVIMLLWLVRCRNLKILLFRRNLFILAVGMIVAVVFTYMGVKYIPIVVNRSFTMERDMYKACIDLGETLPVKAAEIGEHLKNSRLFEKFQNLSVTHVLSRRNYYYKAYIRQMNLWGHFKDAVAFGVHKLPHNAFLGIAYRYGVVAFIPYFLMVVYVLKTLYKKIFENKEHSFLAFSVCFTGIFMSMADNIEIPFMWCTWFGIYLMMGVGFVKGEDKSIICKKE